MHLVGHSYGGAVVTEAGAPKVSLVQEANPDAALYTSLAAAFGVAIWLDGNSNWNLALFAILLARPQGLFGAAS